MSSLNHLDAESVALMQCWTDEGQSVLDRDGGGGDGRHPEPLSREKSSEKYNTAILVGTIKQTMLMLVCSEASQMKRPSADL